MSEQIKPFLEQRDNLTKQEFPVGNKEIKWKFGKYNPEKEEFTISGQFEDMVVVINISIPKAKEYYQNPDLLVASAVIGISSNDSTEPLKFTLQGPEGDTYHTRNVYSGKLVNNRIVMVNNGTVVDTDTVLMWQQGENDKEMNWDSAIAYCKGLSLAGYNDWRLPNIEELKSLIDVKKNPQ